ncbi:MAG: hypothetical protein AB7G80_09195 [Dongiaceae bacterium]
MTDINDSDIEKLLIATALYNTYGRSSSEEDALLDKNDEIIKTHEPIENFIDKNWHKTHVENLFIKPDFQSKKGSPRTNLFVMECGDYRLIGFMD